MIADKQCPFCGGDLNFVHPGSHHYACQRCGRLYTLDQLQSDTDVIEVHAEPLNGDEGDPDRTIEPEGPYKIISPVEPARASDFGPRPRPFYVHMERRVQGGPGCCSFGCLGLFLLFLILLRGCF